MSRCSAVILRPLLLRRNPSLELLRSISSPPALNATHRLITISSAAASPSPLPSDIRSCNEMLSSIGRARGIDEARALFDRMPQRDLVTYASMISLYLKDGLLQQAEALFRRLPRRTVVIESAMIDGYAKAGRLEEAQKVFDAMEERNVVSWTSLLSGYCRLGRIDEARWIFDQMPTRNVVSWTTMLLGYARSGLLEVARELFEQMPERNVVAWTAMIKGYIENGYIDYARELFDRMPEPNVYTWNIMISGYLDSDRAEDAMHLFQLMPYKNTVSWTTMVSGMARKGLTVQAWELFEQMPIKDIAAWNAMITAYVNKGFMNEARMLFDSMPKRNIVTWNAMTDGYAKNGFKDEAMRLLICMLRSLVKPNEATLTGILANSDSNIVVREIHGLANRLGFNSNTSFMNALINLYSRTGDLNSAWLTFHEVEIKDVISWTAMILAYSNHGHSDYALELFALMLRHEVMPDGITYLGVLSACSHAGLVEKGKKIFGSMERIYDLEPTAEHYSCLVDLLGRAGQLEEAKAMVMKMPASKRDEVVLGALLGACKLHDQVEEACNVGEELIELDPSSSGGYVLLANIHASQGQWTDVARLRKMMKERKVKKVPGISHIEVNTKDHVFFAGDRSHPEAKQIYAMLKEELLPHMKDMGYSQLTCYDKPITN
ncbi:pentatricopeptide repeat-containing protein At4g02750-like [Zingiber officinale]|uniref:Chlororespiratory reduction 4 n=1 Tax=Zingiber officinale TaxID=94328 RepID=A0A8J5G3T3_ZINOF|nr:pentatricopeptide repeat-containing protein At4g02750-like [Zingiber officinale]XP_042405768.1 pentatricopeptide repeat-containing protein At4g02750-like [Zingiber officinale]KAG6499096.1 hypothetical protein ZIOFF_038852 [Zingiber officinale]